MYITEESEHEPEDMNWSRYHKGMFTLSSHAYAACFHLLLRTTCPREVTPTSDWAFPHHFFIYRCPTDMSMYNLMEVISRFKFPFYRWIYFVSSWAKLHSTQSSLSGFTGLGLTFMSNSFWVLLILKHCHTIYFHCVFPFQLIPARSSLLTHPTFCLSVLLMMLSVEFLFALLNSPFQVLVKFLFLQNYFSLLNSIFISWIWD